MISMFRACGKEKSESLFRIRTYDLPNTGQALYPLDLQKTLFTILLLLWYLIEGSFTKFAGH